MKVEIIKIAFLFILISAQLHGQQDSILLRLNTTLNPSEIKTLVSDVYKRCGDELECYQVYIQRASDIPITETKAVFLQFLAESFFVRLDQLQPAKTIALKSLKLMPGSADIVNKSWVYITLSRVYRELNLIDSAIIYADLSEKLLLNYPDDKELKAPYFEKYLSYLYLKNYEKADQYLIKAYNAVKNSKNRKDRGFLLYTIVLAKKNRGTPAEFTHWLDKYLQFKEEGSKKLSPHHSGIEVFFNDKLKGLEILTQKVKKLNQNNDTIYSRDRLYLFIADEYKEISQYRKAINHYLLVLNGSSSVMSKKHAHHGLSEVYKNMNMVDSAVFHLNREIALQESSYKALYNKTIVELEVKYATQEKEKNLAISNANLAEQKSKSRLYITILGSIILISLLGFYYFRKRNKLKNKIYEQEAEINERKISQLQKENKLLSLHSMIEGQEMERLRIAQDLHDGLGGLLTSVKAHFNSIQSEIDSVKDMKIYDRTNRLIDEACGAVRRISHDMVPHSINISGLKGAMEELQRSIKLQNVECELETFGDLERIVGQKASMIYRIIQELANNAIKHGKSSRIFLQFMIHENDLHILVEDNGKGFDINHVTFSNGMGLKSIDSRIKYLNGNLNIDSTIGKGTIVNIEVPLNEQEDKNSNS